MEVFEKTRNGQPYSIEVNLNSEEFLVFVKRYFPQWEDLRKNLSRPEHADNLLGTATNVSFSMKGNTADRRIMITFKTG